MKKIFYLFAALFVITSLQSCKRIQDENGDLLYNADAIDEGLTGERFLYREYDQGQLVKEYHFNQRNLMEVVEPRDSSVVRVEYNGNRINSLTYTKVYDGDSTAYKRLYYYDDQGKVNEIKEDRIFKQAGQDDINSFKSIYAIGYENNKLTSIVMRTGQEVDGQDFAYTAYTRAEYVYDGDNVISQTKAFGMMNGNDFGNLVSRSVYLYENYDDKIAPFTLIPYDFKISQMIDYEPEAYRFSANNVRKITYSSTANPNPVTITTLFTYDPQDYALLGFGKMYDYRPF